MGFQTHYIKEMLVIGDTANTDVIAFDKWIYLLNPDDEEKNQPIMIKISNQLNLTPEDVIPDDFDLRSFYSNIINVRGDILIGNIHNKDLYINDEGTMKLDPKSSELVRKVVKQLGLKSASYSEDFDSTQTTVLKKKQLRIIPDIAYYIPL